MRGDASAGPEVDDSKMPQTTTCCFRGMARGVPSRRGVVVDAEGKEAQDSAAYAQLDGDVAVTVRHLQEALLNERNERITMFREVIGLTENLMPRFHSLEAELSKRALETDLSSTKQALAVQGTLLHEQFQREMRDLSARLDKDTKTMVLSIEDLMARLSHVEKRTEENLVGLGAHFDAVTRDFNQRMENFDSMSMTNLNMRIDDSQRSASSKSIPSKTLVGQCNMDLVSEAETIASKPCENLQQPPTVPMIPVQNAHVRNRSLSSARTQTPRTQTAALDANGSPALSVSPVSPLPVLVGGPPSPHGSFPRTYLRAAHPLPMRSDSPSSRGSSVDPAHRQQGVGEQQKQGKRAGAPLRTSELVQTAPAASGQVNPTTSPSASTRHIGSPMRTSELVRSPPSSARHIVPAVQLPSQPLTSPRDRSSQLQPSSARQVFSSPSPPASTRQIILCPSAGPSPPSSARQTIADPRGLPKAPPGVSYGLPPGSKYVLKGAPAGAAPPLLASAPSSAVAPTGTAPTPAPAPAPAPGPGLGLGPGSVQPQALAQTPASPLAPAPAVA